jgi:pseudaminic acid biosynthesis-associated methylase
VDVRTGAYEVQEMRRGTANVRTPHGTPQPATMNAQEQHWAGAEGNAYAARNMAGLPSALALWAEILKLAPVKSVVEFGANIGTNIRAIRQLLPGVQTAGVEINKAAAGMLQRQAEEVFEESVLTWEPPKTWDLSFTRGVLIHVAPNDLPKVYDRLFRASNRYVLVAEYYNPAPVEIEYRGEMGRLWKRDFAGEMLDIYPLRLVDYGFVWKRAAFAQDDITWFLMEKQ